MVLLPIFTEKLDLGAISDFQDFQKGTFWIIFSMQRAPKSQYPELRVSSQDRPWRDRPASQNGPRTPRDQMFIDLGLISDGFYSVFIWNY